MYPQLKELHSIFAYLVLALLLLAIFLNTYTWSRKMPFGKTNKIVALLGLISTHVQLMFAIVLYFLSPLGFSNFSGAAMKDAVSRLYVLEHPLMMILASALITIGYMKGSRAVEDNSKYKNIVVFYSIGLIVILSRLPWATWL